MVQSQLDTFSLAPSGSSDLEALEVSAFCASSRLLLLWLAKDYCLIIPGKALTLSLLLRLNHPLLQSLKLSRHSLKTEILQDLILIPDQLTNQLGPPDPLRIRSILRLCILVRSLDQILNRLDNDLPLRLPPSIDTLLNLRLLTNLILAHRNLHTSTRLVRYVQESRTKRPEKGPALLHLGSF